VTDNRHADAMIRAVARGVPVRIISEPTEYRNPDRVWVGKHIDRMYMAGVQIKMANHGGIAHQASVVMHGLGEVIFGSSNWTTASAGYQDEHNFFYDPSLNKPWFFQFFVDQFTRKWNDAANYYPFTPLPPDVPVNAAPASGASVNGTSATLVWDGGPWAHLYDIYFGTSPNPPLIKSDQELGSPIVGQSESYTVTGLQPGTTYYWRVVGKTWAQLARSSATWSFTTSGAPPGGGGTTPFTGTPAAIPGTFQAEDFDNGGASLAYFDTTAGNSGGSYRTTDVDIEPSSDTGGGFNLSKTRAGEWLRYSVNVATAGTYTFEARVANMGTGATFRVEVDGVDRTGPLSVPDTGGWQTYQTVSKPGIQLTAGPHVVRIVLASVSTANGAGNFNWFRFSAGATTPPPNLAFGGTPVALPGIVQAENFDVGGAGVSYGDAATGNRGGVYRTGDVDIDATADPGSAGHYVGWTRVGEYLEYTVNVTQTRTYSVGIRVANVGSGATFRILVDGVDRSGPISLPNTGAWDSWQTITVSGIPLTQGQRVIRLEMLTRNAENSGVGNFGYLQFR
jgi:Carbohydrate binding module (family 6)/PLD-like domain